MYEVLIAHLRECAKLDPSENTYAEAADAIEELSEQLEAETEYATALNSYVPQWIPVTERLPENGADYLARIVSGEFKQVSWIEIASFDGHVFRWEHNSEECPEEVTHWMPLPQTPKEE